MSIAEMAYQETLTEEGKRQAEHDRLIAIAERAVINAALAWRVSRNGVIDTFARRCATQDRLDAACAALESLKKE